MIIRSKHHVKVPEKEYLRVLKSLMERHNLTIEEIATKMKNPESWLKKWKDKL